MNSRILRVIAIGLLMLILGAAWFIFSARNQAAIQAFPATIYRDCAPLDGPAFTLSIPYDAGSIIYISIWQSPDIKLPVTFSFPDDTGGVGNAAFLLRFSYSVNLTGKVFFWRVEQGSPVVGKFDLVTEAGQQLEGKFEAEWENQPVYCG